MSSSPKKQKKEPPELPTGDDEYKIGYGKPPIETRFKKGKSGNPRGRPKGAKNRMPAINERRLQGLILEEAYRDVDIRENGITITYSMAKAVMRSIAVNAAKGNLRAQKLFTELAAEAERSRIQEHNEFLEEAVKYKVKWEIELADRKRTGCIGPEPVPHPDDIILDFITGDVRIKGPMTKEEKEHINTLRARKNYYEEKINAQRNELEENPEQEDFEDIEQSIRRHQILVDRINEIIPDRLKNSSYPFSSS